MNELSRCMSYVPLSSHLVRRFTFFFQSIFSVASHGRVPADVLLPIRCMLDSFEGRCIMPAGFSVRSPGSWLGCLMPGGLLSAISGILAGGILGFGAAEWFVFLDTFARSCCVVWWSSFVSVQDLVIHWHTSCLHIGAVLVSACFAGFCGFCVCVFALFLCFWLSVWPDKTSDCVKVRAPLSTPQSETAHSLRFLSNELPQGCIGLHPLLLGLFYG